MTGMTSLQVNAIGDQAPVTLHVAGEAWKFSITGVSRIGRELFISVVLQGAEVCTAVVHVRDHIVLGVANSNRRCNAGGQCISRRGVPEGLARARVESLGDRIEVVLRHRPEVGAIREVLPKQAIGVLVGAALPRAVRVAEVHLDVGRHGEGLVRGEFHPAIPGERRHQARRQTVHAARERRHDALRVFVRHRHEHDEARARSTRVAM